MRARVASSDGRPEDGCDFRVEGFVAAGLLERGRSRRPRLDVRRRWQSAAEEPNDDAQQQDRRRRTTTPTGVAQRQTGDEVVERGGACVLGRRAVGRGDWLTARLQERAGRAQPNAAPGQALGLAPGMPSGDDAVQCELMEPRDFDPIVSYRVRRGRAGWRRQRITLIASKTEGKSMRKFIILAASARGTRNPGRRHRQRRRRQRRRLRRQGRRAVRARLEQRRVRQGRGTLKFTASAEKVIADYKMSCFNGSRGIDAESGTRSSPSPVRPRSRRLRCSTAATASRSPAST